MTDCPRWPTPQNDRLYIFFTTNSIWVLNKRAWLIEYDTLWQVSNQRWPPLKNCDLHIFKQFDCGKIVGLLDFLFNVFIADEVGWRYLSA